MQPQLLIFDFDGTLADTTEIIVSTCRLTIAGLNYEPRTDAQLKSIIGLPLREAFRHLFPQCTDTELDRCADTYRRIFYERKAHLVPQLYPGVKETLDALAARGVTLSIASSRSYNSLIEYCDIYGITRHFALVLGCDNVERAKPHPEPVLKTLRTLGVAADRTVVVGDMPVDVAMGRGAGCRTVGVSYGNSSREDLQAAGADCVIDRFAGLLPAVFAD